MLPEWRRTRKRPWIGPDKRAVSRGPTQHVLAMVSIFRVLRTESKRCDRASFPNMMMDTNAPDETSPAPCDFQELCCLSCLLNPVKSSSSRPTQIGARLGKRRRRYASLGRLFEAVGEFDQSRLAAGGASESDTQRRGFRDKSLRKWNGGGIRNHSERYNYRGISSFGRYGSAACARKDERI
jgi:hypothetical protein